jgi:type I restriction enzyme M protein
MNRIGHSSRTKELFMSALSNFQFIKPEHWLFQDYGVVANARAQAEKYKRTYGSLKGAEYQIEEFIRQWILKKLIDTYHYPSHWIGTQINIEEPVFIGSSRCRADIALKNRFDYPFIYIETKSYVAGHTDFWSEERQLMSYLSSMHTTHIGCVTNGNRTTFLKKNQDNFGNRSRG